MRPMQLHLRLQAPEVTIHRTYPRKLIIWGADPNLKTIDLHCKTLTRQLKKPRALCRQTSTPLKIPVQSSTPLGKGLLVGPPSARTAAAEQRGQTPWT